MISAFGVDHGRDTVSKLSDKTKRNSEIGGAAVAGGGAAQGLYQMPAYGGKKLIRDYYGHNKKMSEMPADQPLRRPARMKTKMSATRTGRLLRVKPVKPQRERKKAWEAAKKTQIGAGLPPQGETKAKFFRTLPKDAPFAKTQRVMGYTHAGKLGTAVGTAATLGGAAAAGTAAARYKRKKA